jgi:hypothetical protein
LDKKDPKLSLSELLSMMTRIQLYLQENDHRHHHKFIKYEKRLRKEDKMPRLTYQASKIFATSAWVWTSIHMTFYVNPSWACALFRNNKQHVVLGQKRKCQRVEESGLWRIQRERGIEVQYLPHAQDGFT